jgi:hypothetical protein
MQLSEVLDLVAGLPTKDREKVLGLARKPQTVLAADYPPSELTHVGAHRHPWWQRSLR